MRKSPKKNSNHKSGVAFKETFLNRATRNLCPVCLRAIDGRIVSRGKAVYLEKSCPEHGHMESRIWPDVDHYEWMRTFSLPVVRPEIVREPIGDCPRGCGICTRHLRKTTLVEIELTRRCNMRCPVCFMGAEEGPDDPDLEAIRSMYASILEEMGPHVSIQLTGGEPTIRSDLPEIVRLGADLGFSAIEINTNGLALSRNPGLTAELKEAGASGIYLQFDGLTPEVYRSIRGADLLADKLRVIERCREAEHPGRLGNDRDQRHKRRRYWEGPRIRLAKHRCRCRTRPSACLFLGQV